jgi:hypothetical protein
MFDFSRTARPTFSVRDWQLRERSGPHSDPTNGLVFRDLSKPPFAGNEDLQANLIMPEPTVFLSRSPPGVLDRSPDRDARGSDEGCALPRS